MRNKEKDDRPITCFYFIPKYGPPAPFVEQDCWIGLENSNPCNDCARSADKKVKSEKDAKDE